LSASAGGLNSYLTNRLLGVTDSPVRAALLSGTIFAALHWPNPVLIPLTFIGGVAMAWLFARDRNIIPLAIGQGILGTLVWWAFRLRGITPCASGRVSYTFTAMRRGNSQIQMAVSLRRRCHHLASASASLCIVCPNAPES